jgi:hypothetical protein
MKEEESKPMVDKIQQIISDIDSYKQAIEDARNALATAERELDEALEAEMNKEE